MPYSVFNKRKTRNFGCGAGSEEEERRGRKGRGIGAAKGKRPTKLEVGKEGRGIMYVPHCGRKKKRSCGASVSHAETKKKQSDTFKGLRGAEKKKNSPRTLIGKRRPLKSAQRSQRGTKGENQS